MNGRNLSMVVRIETQDVYYDWFNPYKIIQDDESVGTGFFIDNGYILTCAHVIGTAMTITFTIPGVSDKSHNATLVSVCYDKDLALLRTDYKNNSYLKLGNSDNVNYGSKLYAVGYPMGQKTVKVTSGVFSGMDGILMQIDTPINPGNSGGPLINDQYEVVGINVKKVNPRLADNIGYAVPIHNFKIIKSIMYSGVKVIKNPKLLCDFNNTDDNLKEYYGIHNGSTGYYIKKIYRKSPLYKQGVRTGDILYSINNINISNTGYCQIPWVHGKLHITEMMHRFTILSKLNISYWSSKEQKLRQIQITFDKNYPFLVRTKYPRTEQIDYEIFGGMIIMDLTINHIVKAPDITSNFHSNVLQTFLDKEKRLKGGVIIVNILSGSNLKSRKLIDRCSIITEINDKKVHTLGELRDAMKYCKSINDKWYIKLKTLLDTVVVFKIDKILEEDKILSKKYKYEHTKCFYILNNLISNNTNIKSNEHLTNNKDRDIKKTIYRLCTHNIHTCKKSKKLKY